MARQNYLNWASMVAHYMRAHNQWLCMACQGVEEAYLASFRRVSRNHLEERLLDQAQARASYTPPFLGSFA